MVQTRIEVAKLTAGDIVRQRFDSKEGNDIRHVVVGKVEPFALPYRGRMHDVVRVTGLDVQRSREVIWLAVPDQHLTVVREN